MIDWSDWIGGPEVNAGFSKKALRLLLLPVSLGYGAVMAVRNFFYDQGWLFCYRSTIPVVSIGNLTTGGTGKTPFVAWLVAGLKRLLPADKKMAVVSRGYGAAANKANDETLLLERLCPGILQEARPNRVASMRRLEARGDLALVLLDDGFQHRRLGRSLDIVLIDATNPFGGGRIFPAGLMREPLSGLCRAGVLVITRADQVSAETLKKLRQKLPAAMECFEATHAPEAIVSLDNKRVLSLDALAGERVLLLSAIANPAAFAETARSLGVTVVGECRFKDHHRYTPEEVQQIRARQEALCTPDGKPPLVLTTAKDGVKLRSLDAGDFLELRIAMRIDRGERLLQMVRERLA